MTPTDVPGLAEVQGRRLANVLHAHRLLQWAAVAPNAMPPDAAVKRAVELIVGHLRRPSPPRVWVGQRRDDDGVEWLELPGVESVRWTP